MGYALVFRERMQFRHQPLAFRNASANVHNIFGGRRSRVREAPIFVRQFTYLQPPNRLITHTEGGKNSA